MIGNDGKKREIIAFLAIIGVLCSVIVLAFTLPGILSSDDDIFVEITSRTEYVPGDDGQVITEVRYVLNNNVVPATCYASVYYPNKVILFFEQQMTNNSFGTHYHNFTIPLTEGVYEYQTKCDLGSRNVTRSKAFHVSSGFRRLNSITIVPQGMIEVELGKTASEAWLFDVQDDINLSDAECAVYWVNGTDRVALSGVLYSQDFEDIDISVNYTIPHLEIPEWYAVTSNSGLHYNIVEPDNITGDRGVFTSYYRGLPNPWGGSLGVNFTERLPNEDVAWQMSWYQQALYYYGWSVSTYQEVHFADVLTISEDLHSDIGYTNTYPIGDFGLVGFGMRDTIYLPDTEVWKGENYTAATGTGNLFVRVWNSSLHNDYQWFRTNFSFDPYEYRLDFRVVYDVDEYVYMYVNDTLVASWYEPNMPNPVGMGFGGLTGNPATRGMASEFVLKTLLEDSYVYDDVAKTFTYYWIADKQLFDRGENYMVDCDIDIQRDTGVEQQKLIQYVYINNAKPLKMRIVS